MLSRKGSGSLKDPRRERGSRRRAAHRKSRVGRGPEGATRAVLKWLWVGKKRNVNEIGCRRVKADGESTGSTPVAGQQGGA